MPILQDQDGDLLVRDAHLPVCAIAWPQAGLQFSKLDLYPEQSVYHLSPHTLVID